MGSLVILPPILIGIFYLTTPHDYFLKVKNFDHTYFIGTNKTYFQTDRAVQGENSFEICTGKTCMETSENLILKTTSNRTHKSYGGIIATGCIGDTIRKFKPGYYLLKSDPNLGIITSFERDSNFSRRRRRDTVTCPVWVLGPPFTGAGGGQAKCDLGPIEDKLKDYVNKQFNKVKKEIDETADAEKKNRKDALKRFKELQEENNDLFEEMRNFESSFNSWSSDVNSAISGLNHNQQKINEELKYEENLVTILYLKLLAKIIINEIEEGILDILLIGNSIGLNCSELVNSNWTSDIGTLKFKARTKSSLENIKINKLIADQRTMSKNLHLMIFHMNQFFTDQIKDINNTFNETFDVLDKEIKSLRGLNNEIKNDVDKIIDALGKGKNAMSWITLIGSIVAIVLSVLSYQNSRKLIPLLPTIVLAVAVAIQSVTNISIGFSLF